MFDLKGKMSVIFTRRYLLYRKVENLCTLFFSPLFIFFLFFCFWLFSPPFLVKFADDNDDYNEGVKFTVDSGATVAMFFHLVCLVFFFFFCPKVQ